MEKLSAEDLAAALDAEPISDDFDIATLRTNILGELQRRFGEDGVKDIPDYVLARLGQEVLKAADKAPPPVEEEPEELSEIIAHAGLPAARKRELVRAEILRASAELDRLNGMLDELEAQ